MVIPFILFYVKIKFDFSKIFKNYLPIDMNIIYFVIIVLLSLLLI